jgi:hypothetical protein
MTIIKITTDSTATTKPATATTTKTTTTTTRGSYLTNCYLNTRDISYVRKFVMPGKKL